MQAGKKVKLTNEFVVAKMNINFSMLRHVSKEFLLTADELLDGLKNVV